ncbi:SGNH hydrolase [Trichoderma barbatum]
MRLSLLLIPAAVIVGPFVAAFPTDTSEPVQLGNSSLNKPGHENDLARSSTVARAAISVPLRIMPLGDSISWGSMSSTGNGYRGYLGDYLASLGVPDIDFIGTLKNGKMLDNDNEGHSGSFFIEIKGYSLFRDVAGAPDCLAAIIDQLFEKCPDATIFVAQIISSTDQVMQARTNSYNAAIADLVNQRQKSQKHTMAVDMSKILSTATDLADKKHPNDAGYSKMAIAWQKAILRANDAGWIKKPAPYEGL